MGIMVRYIPDNGSCRIYITSRRALGGSKVLGFRAVGLYREA